MQILVLMLPGCFGGDPTAITSPKPPPCAPETAILTKIVPILPQNLKNANRCKQGFWASVENFKTTYRSYAVHIGAIGYIYRNVHIIFEYQVCNGHSSHYLYCIGAVRRFLKFSTDAQNPKEIHTWKS